MLKERASTIKALAEAATLFYRTPTPSAELVALHVTPDVIPALRDLSARLADIIWEKTTISAALKDTLAAHNLKMPKLAMPVRVLLTGDTHTPAIDATLELLGQARVIELMQAALAEK